MADKFEFSNQELAEMKRAVKIRWILSAAIVLANLLLVWAAWCDHGWGRLGLANLWGPVGPRDEWAFHGGRSPGLR